jgi:hypothetical protein
MAIHKPPSRVGASPFTEGDLVREQLILPPINVHRNLGFAKSPVHSSGAGSRPLLQRVLSLDSRVKIRNESEAFDRTLENARQCVPSASVDASPGRSVASLIAIAGSTTSKVRLQSGSSTNV